MCIYMPPLGHLLVGSQVDAYKGDVDDYSCISYDSFMGDNVNNIINVPIIKWLQALVAMPDRLKNAFTAAAFLANQAWMLYSGKAHTLNVWYDMGADTVVPVISVAGIIIVSIVLSTYLFALLALSVYAYVFPRWTGQFNSFTMLRLGAAIGQDQVPLMVGEKTDKIDVLDKIPGQVGDVAEPQEEIGRLGLGAPAMVDMKRRYECYRHDDRMYEIQSIYGSRRC